MPSFYFEQVLQSAQWHRPECHRPVLRLAGIILILSLLYAVYEAYSNGGDVRALGVAGVKYLVLGLVFITTSRHFARKRDVQRCCGLHLQTNGIGDVVQNWLNSVSAIRPTRFCPLLDARDRACRLWICS